MNRATVLVLAALASALPAACSDTANAPYTPPPVGLVLVREEVPRKEIAVLYRSNAQSRVIETALFNAAMPYKVYGGLRFF